MGKTQLHVAFLSLCVSSFACGDEPAQGEASDDSGTSADTEGSPSGTTSAATAVSATAGESAGPGNPTASDSLTSSTTAGGSDSSTGATPTSSEGDSSEGTETGGVPEIPPECEGSVLADLVATMEPGSWAQMPSNDSLLALDMSYALLYWADSGVFDPATRSIRWVGGPGTCCANPPTYQRLAYDELADEWSIEATPYVGAGHSYDGNAFDPATGNHYFARFQDPAVHVHDGSDWSDLPELPITAATTMGLAWFPEMDGVVYVGTLGELALWSDGEWSVLPTPGVSWGTYNVFAEYSPAHGVVFIGGGNGAGRLSYTLDADGTITPQPEAPVHLGNGSSHQFADPATGNIIVHSFDADVWWELDLGTSQWSQIEMDAPQFAGSRFHVPLSHCGVTMFFDHYWERREVHLYRHG